MTTAPVIRFSAVKGISLKRRWHCPHCHITFQTFVTLSEPPTHKCPRKSGRHITFTESEKQQ